jgi:hypothetical protein
MHYRDYDTGSLSLNYGPQLLHIVVSPQPALTVKGRYVPVRYVPRTFRLRTIRPYTYGA